MASVEEFVYDEQTLEARIKFTTRKDAEIVYFLSLILTFTLSLSMSIIFESHFLHYIYFFQLNAIGICEESSI